MINGLTLSSTSSEQNLANSAAGKLYTKGKPSIDDKLKQLQIKDLAVPHKAKPNANDLKALSGMSSMGFLLLNETLLKIGGLGGASKSLKNAGGGGGFASNMLGEASGDVLGQALPWAAKGGKGLLLKMLPKGLIGAFGKQVTMLGVKMTVGAAAATVGMALAGVALMVKDGIAGSKRSKEWGVGKANAAISSALTSSSKGIKGASAGALKYGFIGAAIGTMVFPAFGTAVGGAIGTVVGAVLGYVGGEATSKFFQSAGKGIAKAAGFVFQKGLLPIGKAIAGVPGRLLQHAKDGLDLANPTKGNQITNLMKTDKSLLQKASLLPFAVVGQLGNMYLQTAKGAGTSLVALSKDKKMLKNIAGVAAGLVNPILGIGMLFGPTIGSALKSASSKWSKDAGFLSNVGTFIKDFMGTLWDGLKSWFGDIGKNIKDFFTFDKKGSGSPAPAPDRRFPVRDATFSLNKASSAGSLFKGGSKDVSFDKNDELFLMASTNPARDALVGAVEQLNVLISGLANTIHEYRPQVNTLQTSIDNARIPLQELMSKPAGAYR